MTIIQRLFVDWDRNGVYTNETAYLIAASGQMRLGSPEESIVSPRGMISQMDITLENGDNRFSVLKTTGALYSDISSGNYYQCPMYFEVSINGGSNYYRLFTGVIKGPVETPVTYSSPSTVTFDCRSREELVLNKRVSTSLVTFTTLHDDGATESDIIAQWLDDAGIDSADYTLDPGLFNIEWAWLDDESPIEDIWQIAAACGGYFYCDPDGEFRYENMTHWLFSPHNASSETLTKSDYQGIRIRYDDTELYQTIVVAVAGRRTLESGVIWEANETYSIPPGGSQLVTAQYQQPAYSITAVSYAAQSAGGLNMAANVEVSAANYYAQRADITLSNDHATLAAQIRNFQIYGQTVHGGPAEEILLNSGLTGVGQFWNNRKGRTRRVRGNPYIQNKAQADTLVRFLRDRHQTPRLFMTVNGVLGDPERRLGDRITIDDPDAITTPIEVFVIGISWNYDGVNGGFLQSLDCMAAEGLFYDSGPIYARIGTVELGTADPQRGKTFY